MSITSFKKNIGIITSEDVYRLQIITFYYLFIHIYNSKQQLINKTK